MTNNYKNYMKAYNLYQVYDLMDKFYWKAGNYYKAYGFHELARRHYLEAIELSLKF